MSKLIINNNLIDKISELIKNARSGIVTTINSVMAATYFEVGRMIVEDEQNGKHRADYGKQILVSLSKRLTRENGKGFSVDNLENMRNFYLTYSKYYKNPISETVSRKFKLSWSHYLKLMRPDYICGWF
ncbi:MAG: DUF1016 N-terminal domain-containing protein [Endomicrobium sp.]|jgi:CRISPR/Cas system-associated protein Cas10 (large subunit of type III CRISPR-Cas system)|nr:DUF1016 N-terminal domain-containing protein [Endomicrobium sp.]